MTEMFGQKWIDYIEIAGGLPVAVEVWAKGLDGIRPEEIKRGVHACLVGGRPWPPAIGEFRDMCRPARDPAHEFERAAFILGTQPIDWQGDAVLYATVRAVGGFNVRTLPYSGSLKARWEKALRDAESRSILPPPPEPPAALLVEKPTDRGTALAMIADIKTKLFGVPHE